MVCMKCAVVAMSIRSATPRMISGGSESIIGSVVVLSKVTGCCGIRCLCRWTARGYLFQDHAASDGGAFVSSLYGDAMSCTLMASASGIGVSHQGCHCQRRHKPAHARPA